MAASFASASFWGVDSLAYAPKVLALCVVLPVPLTLQAGRLTSLVASIRCPVMVCGLLFLMLTLAFPSGTRLLGDGELHVRELIGGVWDSHPKMNRSPLLFWLLHQVPSWSFVSPAQIYPWVSRMAGLVFVLLSFTAGRCFRTKAR